jgi:ATP-dependent protease HslVU (ClpYQ) peptidase subunit
VTTIAFDGRTMAADRQISNGNRRERIKTKIRRLRNGALAGAAGDAYLCGHFLDWLDDEVTELEIADECVDDVECVVAFPDGKVFIYNGRGHPIEIDEPVYAIGSGSDFALSMLEVGKSAREAVEYAHTRDTGTGKDVDVLEFAPVKRARKAKS